MNAALETNRTSRVVRTSVAHPNEQLLRDAYTAFGRGDLEGYLRHCSTDFAFHVPGTNHLSRTYRGRDKFFELIGKVMDITGGKFEEVVEDVLANDQTGVVLCLHRFSRNGVAHEYRTAHVYALSNGQFVECWEQPRDQVVFDAAWG